MFFDGECQDLREPNKRNNHSPLIVLLVPSPLFRLSPPLHHRGNRRNRRRALSHTMGSGLVKPGEAPVRLNVAAVSNVVHLTKDELFALMKQCRDFAGQSQPLHSIDRENFLAACEIIGLHESDTEILDKLFTLFDQTGEDLVVFRTLVASFAMIIRGTMAEKVQFAMQLYDVDMKKKIAAPEMITLLSALADCMDFFGDLKLPSRKIQTLVENIFQESDRNEDAEVDITECFIPLSTHPLTTEFMDKAVSHASQSVLKMGL